MPVSLCGNACTLAGTLAPLRERLHPCGNACTLAGTRQIWYNCIYVIGSKGHNALNMEERLKELHSFDLVQRILSNWQFDLPISLIALLPKPRRSHHYACVCEAALSEKYSASNYPKLNFRCTRFVRIHKVPEIKMLLKRQNER